MHLRTKFQLDKSKFAWVRQFWKNSQKVQNVKKCECSNRFWPNSIPEFLDGFHIFVCSFRTIARILRKLELSRPFFKKFKIPYNHKSGTIVMKIVMIACCDCFTSLPKSISQAVYELSGFQALKIGHIHTRTRTHTHTSGRQLKITFLDVLDYSEYSDTNISKKFFFTKT